MIFSIELTTPTIILLSASLACALLLIPLYLRRIARVSRHAAAQADDLADIAMPDNSEGFRIEETPGDLDLMSLEPASVVVYAQDEAESLARLLPKLLGQNYPAGFEVIVVNEGASEATSDVVSALSMSHKNLYLTFTPDGARNLSRKKLGMMLGIKAARNRVVVNTTAGVEIESPLWLTSMMRNFKNDGTEVVIGYALPADTDTRMGRRRRAFDFTARAVAWLTSAISGRPYRGTEFNIAYTRELFFRNKGFSRSLNLRYGDDDIFISEIATGANTAVELSPESMVRIAFRNHRRGHAELLRRHLFTGRYVSHASRRLMALGGWLLWCVTGCAVAAAVISLPNLVPAIAGAVIILATLIWTAIVWRNALTRLQSRRMLFTLPWLAMTLPLRNMAHTVAARLRKGHDFTWH